MRTEEQTDTDGARLLMLEAAERAGLWRAVAAAVEAYTADVRTLRIRPELDPEAIRGALSDVDFGKRMSPDADVAESEGLWLHADAAWAGGAALVPEMRNLLAGIHRADSITFDPHKWLSVPRGAGLYLTRHREILGQTFGVQPAYMPRKKTAGMNVVDPFTHSMQWSRRFIGLQVFLSLLVAGWDGYARAIRHQVDVARHLARELTRSGWKVVDDQALAVVCFVDGTRARGREADYLEAVAEHVRAAGAAWVSTTAVAGLAVLRACVTNYRTEKPDADALVAALDEARRGVRV